MSPGVGAGPPLSDPATRVAWRIFGGGESPLKGRSSYELIRPIIEHRVTVADQQRVMREIQVCFELHGNRYWLRPEMQERVAEAILDGIGPSHQSETAVWAIGSINSELCRQPDSFQMVHLCNRQLHTHDDQNLEDSV